MKSCLTKSGREFVIRRPVENDAQHIMDYAALLFASTNQVLTTPEEYKITLEEEKKWINSSLTQTNALILVAEMDGEIVGLLDFHTKPRKKQHHIGEFGVSVHPDAQAQGIGRQLIETLIEWAINNAQIEKVILAVFDSNHHAIQLYKELGFVEEGRHIRAIKQPSGEYVDIIQMYITTTTEG